ncbi:MAG: hypothetical protein J7L04_12540 [Bacteroidales bacterium]|nr:hypothetical protein [Bacteroidales bacterium]
MKLAIQLVSLFLLLSSINLQSLAQVSETGRSDKYPDPERFENAIRQFEISDSILAPPAGAIVCIGSSSMRGWHSSIKEDLTPLTIIPRGFGGSNMNDALYYADRIVLNYKPRAIVIYEGDNDIAAGISPEVIKDTFLAFTGKIRKELPKCRIYFISIKPSISRWSMWPDMTEANSLIAKECKKNKRFKFIDVASGMLDDTGKPRKDIFKDDMLHMNRDGYLIWKDAARKVIVKKELFHEPDPNASKYQD